MFTLKASPEKSYVRYFKQFLTLNFPLRPMCLSPGFSSYLYSLNAEASGASSLSEATRAEMEQLSGKQGGSISLMETEKTSIQPFLFGKKQRPEFPH
ncbi:hypothetical protein D5086_022380 [Populus alba]|uniref:Uncharacterized protein n=1 Tax=Populus alba TaxID=43335 RepID=A0ACC4BFL5_POPAL